MLKPIWIVGFTGHRPKDLDGRRLEELESCRPLIQEALEEFQAKAAKLDGEIHCFSSVAEGADTIALEVSEELGIVNHLILPMSVERFADDFNGSPAAWDRALTLIAKTGGLEELNDDLLRQLCGRGGGKYSTPSELPKRKKLWTIRISPGSRERPYCYYECGEEMLESCDGLLAIHSQSTANIGGTTEVIKQAEVKGLVIAAIDPLSKSTQWNSVGDWESDKVLDELHHISEKHSKKFPFSNDIDNLLEDEFNRYNGISLTNGNWFRRSLIVSVLLHFAAASIGVVSLSFGWKDAWAQWATGVELAFVAIAIGLVISSWWSCFHERWRQARFAAEILRSLNQSCKFLDPMAPLITRHHPIWHRFAISNSLRQSPCRKQDQVEELSRYHRERITDQSKYFSSKLTPAWTWGALWKYTALICSIAGFVLLSVAFLFKLTGHDSKSVKHSELGSQQVAKLDEGLKKPAAGSGPDEDNSQSESSSKDQPAPKSDSYKSKKKSSFVTKLCLKFLPTFLPLLASLAITLTVVTDYGRRKERYAIMISRLQELASWFPTIRSPYAAKRAVERCEEILLDELVEWYASNKEITH